MMIYIIVIIILINVILIQCNIVKNVAITNDGDVLLDESLPVAGFISGSSTTKEYDSIVLHLLKRINAPPVCQYIKLINAPIENNKGPNPNNLSTLKSALFEMSTDLHNGRVYWSNGRDILSFIEETNTWIIGYTPGVDSGFVYLKPKEDGGLTPVGFDSNVKWHFLSGSKWKEANEVKAECYSSTVDSYDKGYYYFVEYYDNTEHKMKQSYWVPPITADSGTSIIASNSKLLLQSSFEWLDLTHIKTICGYGHPVVISDKISSNVFHLVNVEHATNPGWRVAFKGSKKKTKNSVEEIEVMFDLSRDGRLSDGYTVQSRLPAIAEKEFKTSLTSQFINIDVGDWVWLFYSHVDKRALIEEKEKVLLKCIKRDSSNILFRFYPNDRLDVMNQSVMSRELEFFKLQLADGKAFKADSNIVMKDNLDYPINVLGAVFIGNDAVSYIKNYLIDKEGEFGDMSSCFMYHASVLIPDPLVYAAEILCLLIGSKPATMIQFTSSTDHQWKFPLVTELSQAIIYAKTFLGNKFDVDYRIHEYRESETLIFYRRSRSYLVDYLLPFNQSQALHPMPYPDSDNPTPDWEEQIYNSWWNGYVLGYPGRFVDSYCESFHNGLEIEGKIFQINKAKHDVKKHFIDNHKEPVEIKYGLDKPVIEEFWQLL